MSAPVTVDDLREALAELAAARVLAALAHVLGVRLNREDARRIKL